MLENITYRQSTQKEKITKVDDSFRIQKKILKYYIQMKYLRQNSKKTKRCKVTKQYKQVNTLCG